MREIARQGEGGEALRGVLARLRTYIITDGDSDWMMSLQPDKPPKNHQKWVEGDGLYLFSTHEEEESDRNRESLDNSTTREVASSPTSWRGIAGRTRRTSRQSRLAGFLGRLTSVRGRGV